MRALLTGSSGGSSKWFKNGAPIPGANSPTYNANSAGIYNMVKTNTNGCADSSPVGKVVTSLAAPIVNLGKDTSICGSSYTLDAGNAGATFTWNTGPITQTLLVNTSGTYIVTVTNSNSCSKSDTIKVNISAAFVTSSFSQIICANKSYLWNSINRNSAGHIWIPLKTNMGVIVLSH
ncbi:MAG: hypothetical protein IPK03_11125 [Bacteroidetes bacterium]|nr:hypothetical protein [Bacteroidota bacterium]